MEYRYQNIISKILDNHQAEYDHVPAKKLLYEWIDELMHLIFPIKTPNKDKLIGQMKTSQSLFYKIFSKTGKSHNEIQELSDYFYGNLENITNELYADAYEILKKDPAATNISEVLHVYSGFYAISIYRISHFLCEKCKISLIPRMLSEYAHSKTGIDIHPKAKIGSPFCIDHGTGIVIGETCNIGKHVNLYQGVTLGALQVSKDLKGKKRHPTVEDNVIIYANSTILGGNTIIGNNSIIGGNVFLTQKIEPYSMVFNSQKTIIKEIDSIEKPINFMI